MCNSVKVREVAQLTSKPNLAIYMYVHTDTLVGEE